MGEPAEFGVAVVSSEHERAIVRVAGDLDMATADSLAEAGASVGGVERLVLDLTECTFLDSAGVRAITSLLRDHGRVSLVVVDPGIRRVLEITALDTMLEIHDSLDSVS